MKTIYKKLLFLVLLLPFSVLAQNVLTGTVLDKASGQPLPGVSVVVQGTTNGTSTDFDGKFSLSNVKKGDVIVFSYIGFSDFSQNYDGQKTMSVNMEESSAQLDEVIVQVGYGSVKKKDATGSITTVTSKDFNKGANVTTENLLNGRVAGLTINTSGAPGSGSQIRIRGGSSLFASNDPLIVLDGLPIENNTNTGSTSFLASLNPNTVESITVLKDASATAIYGSRAANGVIIIVTKKGGKDIKVDYNFQYGSGKLVKTVDVFNAEKFKEMIATYRPGDVPMLGTANTDWQKQIYRTTDFVDNNITVSGSLLKMIPTRLTLGNTYQEGLRLTNAFNRNTVGLAMNPNFFDNHLKIRLNANYSREKNRFADGVEGTAIRFDPTQPVRMAGSPYGGYFEYYNNDATNSLQLAPRNPVAQLMQTNDNGRNRRIFGNIEIDYKFHFLPELRGVVNMGFDESTGARTRYVAPFVSASAGSNNGVVYGTNEFTEETRRNKLLDAYLVYNKTFGDLNVELTGGHSYQIFENERYYTRNTFQPGYGENDLNPETDTATDHVLIAFFGRTNLSFKDKYLLTLSYRQDYSSRFSKQNRSGGFPAAAFAWRINEEFFKESQSFSDFKLRLGYGVTGQQDFPENNGYLQQYQTGDGVSQYYFGTTPTPIAISRPLTPDIRWEETTTYNAGFDYGFIGNRITGAIDVFYKNSDHLIVRGPAPDGGNFSNRVYQNVGSFTTKGIEFSISADVIKTDNMTWNVNFNATKFERRIDELIFNEDIFVGDNIGGTGTPGQVFSENYTPYSFMVYKQLYDTNRNPIEGAYADLNGDGVINTDDKYIYKNPDPDFTFGFASNFNYKNLDFSFNLRASIGNHVFNGVNASQAQTNLFKTDQALNNVPVSVLDTGFSTTSDVLLSDIYIEDASFLRMDNITLGYTFPQWLEGKASLRIFTGVQNAFVLTKYSGLDPEITNNGLDKTIYPRQRSILFGLNVKF